MIPMLGGEAVEGQQSIPVLGQALDGPGVLGAILLLKVLSAFGAKHNSLYIWNIVEAQHLVFLP